MLVLSALRMFPLSAAPDVMRLCPSPFFVLVVFNLNLPEFENSVEC